MAWEDHAQLERADLCAEVSFALRKRRTAQRDGDRELADAAEWMMNHYLDQLFARTRREPDGGGAANPDGRGRGS
ncbi:hypothetical protein GCM10011581_21160 [Saccharopolyspora subtropica]|uniref:Uncharacterized protein n=1 Tax=Saccharopolyspora thermophila TaxID=89367 RepID=A0A917JVL3_9PSEU|nr:hypothetical protein [Saccharopolyspora subtropica]GGI83725.1 hypothetical protein GCM10011581_21160 [Saccharopolyspora subtropica]